MPYVIAAACIDVMDRSCIEECPVDCIYEGGRKLYINPVECIDCGACEAACPVQAISQDRRVPDDQVAFVADNARFFGQPLRGRQRPLGAAGGASITGSLGVDTELVAAYANAPAGRHSDKLHGYANAPAGCHSDKLHGTAA